MATSLSTYYGFVKVREMSPAARDWAATDGNYEVLSLLLKAIEQHSHTGATGLLAPGYDPDNPSDPPKFALETNLTGGVLAPGASVSARLSYVDARGLETDSTGELAIETQEATAPPLSPILQSITPAAPGLAGGSYVYALTKRKGTGETTISDVLVVSIPYDTSYSVTLTFDSIAQHDAEEGITAMNIYRSNGLNSPFQLVESVENPGQNIITDNNTIGGENVNIQPPTSSTYDATRSVRILFDGLLPYPAAAKFLRVYVSQTPNLWGDQTLLKEIDLSGTPPEYVDYIGNETLLPGYPRYVSQIPDAAPKINLATDAIGVPVIDGNVDFSGFQAQNLRLHNNAGAPATPTNGYIYYDTSTNNVRAYINGGWVNWGVTAGTGYVHPVSETGGHPAGNISYGGSNVALILERFADPITGARFAIQGRVRAPGVTLNPTGSNTARNTLNFVPEMSFGSGSPSFNNQWIDVVFNGTFKLNTLGAVLNLCFEVNAVAQSPFSVTAASADQLFTVTLDDSFQIPTGAGYTIKVLWWVSTGIVTAVGNSRRLIGKWVF